jgi:hypothetical protein
MMARIKAMPMGGVITGVMTEVMTGVIAKLNVRRAGRLLLALCLGCGAASASQQPEATAPPQPATGQADAPATGNPAPSATSAPQPAATTPAAHATGSNARHRAASRRAAASASSGGPKKIVVREGGVDEPTTQIVTGMTPQETERERNEAELTLSTTSETLKEIAPRQLDAGQQEIVSRIHNYMKDSRAALKEGDIPRAHTLAIKAGWLADDLARH